MRMPRPGSPDESGFGFFPFSRSHILQATMLVIVLATASVCPAQQPQLAISAPADGAVFNPGQTITVTVTSPANVSFNSVGVIGEGPFGLSNLATAVPAQFSFTVPSNALPGKYMLTADGTTT